LCTDFNVTLLNINIKHCAFSVRDNPLSRWRPTKKLTAGRVADATATIDARRTTIDATGSAPQIAKQVATQIAVTAADQETEKDGTDDDQERLRPPIKHHEVKTENETATAIAIGIGIGIGTGIEITKADDLANIETHDVDDTTMMWTRKTRTSSLQRRTP
jgi:hypothetical protein